MQLAAFLAGPPATTAEDLRSQLQGFGISDDQIEHYLEHNQPEPQKTVVYRANVNAFEWFDQVHDCLKFLPHASGQSFCQGLDLAQVAADLQLNPRDYEKDDYQRLKRLGHYVAKEYNRPND